MSGTNMNLELLIKLLKMTTSANDAEALSFMRKANEQLTKAGWAWDNLLHGKVTVVADPFSGAPIPTATRHAPPVPNAAEIRARAAKAEAERARQEAERMRTEQALRDTYAAQKAWASARPQQNVHEANRRIQEEAARQAAAAQQRYQSYNPRPKTKSRRASLKGITLDDIGL